VPYAERLIPLQERDKCVFCALAGFEKAKESCSRMQTRVACAKITHASRSKEIHPFPETKQRTLVPFDKNERRLISTAVCPKAGCALHNEECKLKLLHALCVHP
jgi:hypothetical protein